MVLRDAREASVPRRAAGFTLIEIMAVVLIIGLLTTIVGAVVFSQVDSARVTTASTQIKQIEAAMDFYRLDNGRYPSSEQGIEALVRRPTIAPEPYNYRAEGYLHGGVVPKDPWGLPYQYESPGSHNTYGFDLWSLGADGVPGGEDTDADIGNWAEES
ncbi:MAG: type II secretion system major pseudopilin GspG [Myxococcota bacterium]